MLDIETSEQGGTDSILEDYLHKQYDFAGRGKVELVELRPERNFYHFKREALPQFNDSSASIYDEEVFLNLRECEPILRRIRGTYQDTHRNIQSIEIFKAGDFPTTLILSREVTQSKDLLFRQKTATYDICRYRTSEPAEKEIGTMGVHSYSLGYNDGEIKFANVDFYINAFSSSEKPVNIMLDFEKSRVIGFLPGVKGRLKVEYGKPLLIDSSSVEVTRSGDQYSLMVTLADGLIRTLTFPKKIYIQAWLTHLNQDGDDWIKESDGFPIRIGIRDARDKGEI